MRNQEGDPDGSWSRTVVGVLKYRFSDLFIVLYFLGVIFCNEKKKSKKIFYTNPETENISNRDTDRFD